MIGEILVEWWKWLGGKKSTRREEPVLPIMTVRACPTCLMRRNQRNRWIHPDRQLQLLENFSTNVV
jgi:hypothetical protein